LPILVSAAMFFVFHTDIIKYWEMALRMWKAGLLTRLATGKGRRASLYAPISRDEYGRKLRQLVLV